MKIRDLMVKIIAVIIVIIIIIAFMFFAEWLRSENV
ncbi:unnamed protein product, partial [marine sediment metagenome]